jgi:hypothetical protein
VRRPQRKTADWFVKTRFKIMASVVAVGGGFLVGLVTRPSSTAARTGDRTRTEEMPAGARMEAPAPIPMPATRPALAEVSETFRAWNDGSVARDELFQAEARDDAWAAPMEQMLEHEYGRYLAAAIPEATDLDVACKQTLCELTFQVPEGRGRAAFARAQVIGLGLSEDGIAPFGGPSETPGQARIGLSVAFPTAGKPAAEVLESFLDWNRRRFPGGLTTVTEDLDRWEETLPSE